MSVYCKKMSTRSEKDRQKQLQDKCQTLLTSMLRDEDNKYCVDCDAKGPRWTSWNLGIFLCIRCAGIHRNLGVHISKVKSVNLDSWTPEQVVSLQQMGNSRARAVYEANLPDSFRRPQSDSALESFIRAKYESRKYIAQEWVQPALPKVNWDKELDEEAERSRKKKREIKTTTPIPVPKKIDIIPQALPKPHSSPKNREGKGGRSRGNSGGGADLLGLDTPTSDTPQSNEDVFTSFLSAVPSAQTASTHPPTTQDVPQTSSKRTEEEESFFNQPLASGQPVQAGAGGKLTTDSILALYSKGPPIPTVNSFGVAQGIQQFPYTQQQQNINQVPMYLNANTSNTIAGGSNPFFTMQQQLGRGQTQNPVLVQQPQQIDIQQQLSGLNLGNNISAASYQNNTTAMSNQLWQ